MPQKEYLLERRVLYGLENNNEEVYQALAEAEKREIDINPDILARVLDNGSVSISTKTLSVRLLKRLLNGGEEEKECLEVIATVRCMYRITEVIRKETERAAASEDEKISTEIDAMISLLGDALEKSTEHGIKDRLVQCMEECGLFILVNAWPCTQVLKMYSGIFSREDTSYIHYKNNGNINVHEKNNRKINEADKKSNSTGYRVLVEEQVHNIAYILAHRRVTEVFMPKQVSIYRIKQPEMYKRIYEIQDEYGVFHRMFSEWCKEKGSFERAEWAISCYLFHLAECTEEKSYEEEIIFAMSPMFYSTICNTLQGTEKHILMLWGYLRMLKRAGRCTLPRVRGTAQAAIERITGKMGKKVLEEICAKKNDVKKIYSAAALAEMLEVMEEKERSSLQKSLERNAQSIVELLEIQPKEREKEHIECVLYILAKIEITPLVLYVPTNMILLAWSFRRIGRDKRVRKWVQRYIRGIENVYNPSKKHFLVNGLGMY